MFSLTVRSCRSAHFPFPPSPWIPGPYHPCHRANPVAVAFSSSYLQFAGSLQHHALHLSDAGVGCLWSSPRTTSPPASLSRPFQASASCPPGTTYCWWRSLLCGAARRLVDIVLELAIERRAHLVWNGSARSTITPPCSSGCATRGPSSSSSSTALPSECMAYARAGARARARRTKRPVPTAVLVDTMRRVPRHFARLAPLADHARICLNDSWTQRGTTITACSTRTRRGAGTTRRRSRRRRRRRPTAARRRSYRPGPPRANAAWARGSGRRAGGGGPRGDLPTVLSAAVSAAATLSAHSMARPWASRAARRRRATGARAATRFSLRRHDDECARFINTCTIAYYVHTRRWQHVCAAVLWTAGWLQAGLAL